MALSTMTRTTGLLLSLFSLLSSSRTISGKASRIRSSQIHISSHSMSSDDVADYSGVQMCVAAEQQHLYSMTVHLMCSMRCPAMC